MLMPMGQLRLAAVESMGIKAKTLSMPGTSEDVAMIIAWEEEPV